MSAKLLPISGARDIGKAKGLDTVIVLQELPDGRWGYTSWGKDKMLCGRAKRIADDLLERTGEISDVAFLPNPIMQD